MRNGSVAAAETWLVVDIGNTRTKLARWHKGRLGREVAVFTRGLSVRSAAAAVREAGMDGTPGAAVLSTVVPASRATWARALAGWTLHWVDHHSPLGIPVSYRRPATIGPDRLVNAAAGAAHGLPVAVVDIGTALTVDVVLPERGFVGGVIAPGPSALTDYLAGRTAQLPPVSFRAARQAIGGSTRQAMRAGAWYGYRGLLREILTEISREAGEGPLVICGTGGHARTLLPDLVADAIIEPRLTQRGLGEIGQRVFGA